MSSYVLYFFALAVFWPYVVVDSYFLSLGNVPIYADHPEAVVAQWHKRVTVNARMVVGSLL